MWMRGEAALTGAAPEQLEALRTASHATRSAITRPLVAVQVLIPDPAVRAAAQNMVTAAYLMREAATTTDALTIAREESRVAQDQFVSAAAAYLAPA